MRAQSLAVVVFSLALALPGAAQSAPQEAGQVSALLPAAHIERGSSSPLEVKLRDPVFWRDFLETEEKARARLSLVDGSLLNVGSKARVQVVENNQATERTELELKFGKVRAQVKERTQPGGRFEIRTDTAVIGVIGTHVYVDGAGPLTTVINFGGKVQVFSSDPAVKKDEILEQFELAEVERGQPIRKRMATLQELLQALEDTLPGLVTQLIPQRVRAGSCVSASSGDPIGGLAEENPNAPNLELAPRGCGAPDITPLRICAPANAAPGVYEYALEGADGIQRWAAYVIEPPTELQDAWLQSVSELPAGATHTARLAGKDGAPLAGVRVHVRVGSKESVLTTDASGEFTLHAPDVGAPPKDTWELTLSKLPGDALLIGQLLGANGGPLEGIPAKLRVGKGEAALNSDAAGTFVIGGPGAKAKAQSWRLTVAELPPGTAYFGYALGGDSKPLSGVQVRIRAGGEDTTLATDAKGAFVFRGPASRRIEIQVEQPPTTEAGAGTPFEAPEPLRAVIQVVEQAGPEPELEDFSQRGTLVTVKGEVEQAQLGGRTLPLLHTVTRGGQTFSSLPIPRDMPEGSQVLELQEPGGKTRREPLFVYDIVGSRLDQHLLSSGALTQGEFLVCVAGGPQTVKAHIVAFGPVHFRGVGAQGKRFEQAYGVTATGLLRIPFQIQAEKGSPTGIPFVLTLRLQRD